MIIHIIIKSVIGEYGEGIIGGHQLLNILNDIHAFKYEVPALRNTLRIILDAYGTKILSAKKSGKPGELTLKKFKEDFCNNYAMKEDVVEYVFDSLGYGIGWIDYVKSNVVKGFSNVVKGFYEYDHNERLKCYALMYYYMGFYTYDIKGKTDDGYTKYSLIETIDTFKHPTKECEKNRDKAHDLKFIESIDRSKSTGIGCFTGYNDIVVLDFDYISCKIEKKSESSFRLKDCINQYLSVLGLPGDYQWVVLSQGMTGIHIYVKIKNTLQIGLEYTALSSTRFCTEEYFERIEVIWKKNIVLPPTRGRFDGYIWGADDDNHWYYKYQFFQNQYNIPTCEPSYITIDQLNTFLDYYCGEIAHESFLIRAGKYMELFYNGKCSGRSSMEVFLRSDDDIKWVGYCKSEIGRIAYAVLHLARTKKYEDAYNVFIKYDSDIAHFNAASLIAYGAIKGNKSVALSHYKRINKNVIDDYYLKQLKLQLEHMQC